MASFFKQRRDRLVFIFGLSSLVIIAFQNCSKMRFSPAQGDFATALLAIPCEINGMSSVTAGQKSGVFSVSCGSHSILSTQWGCTGSEGGCGEKTLEGQGTTITPASYASAESIVLSSNIQLEDGKMGIATKTVSVIPLPPSTDQCGYKFKLSVDISAVTGQPPMDLKNASTCRCSLTATLPGMTLIKPGVYQIDGTNDRMTLNETPVLDKATNTATCNLKCADSEHEPSVDPRGALFCSSCKVPASIKDTAGLATLTWDFIKDDSQKVCFYARAAWQASTNPTFRVRNSSVGSEEPSSLTMGYSDQATYFKFDPNTKSYSKSSAKDLIPNCRYYYYTGTNTYTGIHSTSQNPTSCTIYSNSSGGASRQDQTAGSPPVLNARYFWCYAYASNAGSGDCYYSSGGDGGGSQGGGSGGGYSN